MNEALLELLSGFGLGLATGLWLGFKLWRVTYVERR
jgi:hypothetical protein